MGLPTIRFIARTGSAQQGMNKLGNATIRFSQVASSNIARVGAAIGAVSALSGRMASDLDEQLRRVQNLTGFSEEQRLALSDRIDQLSRKHGLDARMLAQGAEAIHTQGVAVGNLGKELELASKVANAFGGNFEDIARNLTKMANVWDINTDNIIAYGQAGARIGDTNLSKLLEGSTVVSPAAKQAGVDYDEMAIFMGFATRELKNTRLAATALRQVFDELARSNSTVATTIQNKYGNTFKELVEQAGNAYDVFARIEKDFGRSRFIQLLSSVDAKSGLTTILQQLDDIREEAAIPLNVHAEGLEEAFANIAISFDERVRVMRETWRSLLRSTVDVQPGSNIYNAVEALTTLLEHGDFRDSFKQLSESLTTFAPVASSLAQSLASVLTVNIPGTETSGVDLAVYSYLMGKSMQWQSNFRGKMGEKIPMLTHATKHMTGRTTAQIRNMEDQIRIGQTYDTAFKAMYVTDPKTASMATAMWGKDGKLDGRRLAPIGSQAMKYGSIEEYHRELRKDMLKDPNIQKDIKRQTYYGGKWRDPSTETMRVRSKQVLDQGFVSPDARYKSARGTGFRASAAAYSGMFLHSLGRGLSQTPKIGKHFSSLGEMAGKASNKEMMKGLSSGMWSLTKGIGAGLARAVPMVAGGVILSDILKGMTGVDILGGATKGVGKVISWLNPFDGGGKVDSGLDSADKINQIMKDFRETLKNDEKAQKEIDRLGENEVSKMLWDIERTLDANALTEQVHRSSEQSELISHIDDMIDAIKDSGLSPEVEGALLSIARGTQTQIETGLDLDTLHRTGMGDIMRILQGDARFGSTIGIREMFELGQAQSKGDLDAFTNVLLENLTDGQWNTLRYGYQKADSPGDYLTAAQKAYDADVEHLSSLSYKEWEDVVYPDEYPWEYAREDRRQWTPSSSGLIKIAENDWLSINPVRRLLGKRPETVDDLIIPEGKGIQSREATTFVGNELWGAHRAEEQDISLAARVPYIDAIGATHTSFGETGVSNLKTLAREVAALQAEVARGEYIDVGRSPLLSQGLSGMSPEHTLERGYMTSEQLMGSNLGLIEGVVFKQMGEWLNRIVEGYEQGDLTYSELLKANEYLQQLRDDTAESLGLEKDRDESRNIYYSGIIYSDYDASVGV